jgi:hypothetical protein
MALLTQVKGGTLTLAAQQKTVIGTMSSLLLILTEGLWLVDLEDVLWLVDLEDVLWLVHIIMLHLHATPIFLAI